MIWEKDDDFKPKQTKKKKQLKISYTRDDNRVNQMNNIQQITMLNVKCALNGYVYDAAGF